MAAGYLNLLLGNVGQKGGVQAPAQNQPGSRPVYANALVQLDHAQFVFLDGVDPLYTLPAATGAAEKLARVETVISFSPFLNDSATYADLLLPDHHSLEEASLVFPPVAPGFAANVATPFVRPLYDTRATEQVLAELAKKLNVAFSAPTPKSAVEKLLPEGEAWDNVVRRGGFWTEPAANERLQTYAPRARSETCELPRHRVRVPAALPPILLRAISRWQKRPSSVDAGNARSSVERDVEFAGRD